MFYYPFIAQSVRAIATLTLVPAAAHLWPTDFVGHFFLCISVGFFASIFLDQGFSSSGYYLLSSHEDAYKKQLLRAITSRRLGNIAALPPAGVILAAFYPHYAVMIYSTLIYASSLALSLSFYFNAQRQPLAFIASEAAAPLSLLAAPTLTIFGVRSDVAFLVAAITALTGMFALAVSTAGLPRGHDAKLVRPAWSVALARMVTYGFTMITAPVATALYGSVATASIALADRSNGFVGMLIVPLGATLAGHTARAGPTGARLAGRTVALAAGAFVLAWIVYVALLTISFPAISPLLFGDGNPVDLALILLFAVASLLSGLNTFMVAGFITPLGRFNSTLACAGTGAIVFAISIAVAHKFGPISVPIARVASEGAVTLLAGALFVTTLLRLRGP